MTQRNIVFEPEFLEDLRFWIETNRRIALKVLDLVDAVMRDPYEGIGKPEPLRYEFSGLWSRRIDREHRLLYTVSEERINFIQARYHYE